MFLVRIIASMAVNNSTFSLLACYNNQVPTRLFTEGYPSGLRGWFAKSLVWGNLEREFESPLLRQKNNSTKWSGYFHTDGGEIQTPR